MEYFKSDEACGLTAKDYEEFDSDLERTQNARNAIASCSVEYERGDPKLAYRVIVWGHKLKTEGVNEEEIQSRRIAAYKEETALQT